MGQALRLPPWSIVWLSPCPRSFVRAACPMSALQFRALIKFAKSFTDRSKHASVA